MSVLALRPLLLRTRLRAASLRWRRSLLSGMPTRPAPSEAGSSTDGAGAAPSSKRARVAPAVPVAPYSLLPADAPALDEVLAAAHAAGRSCPVPFRTGLFLAPMVRSGSLPTRLLSLQYGASLVWGPEIVDRAIMGCTRVVNGECQLLRLLRAGGVAMAPSCGV